MAVKLNVMLIAILLASCSKGAGGGDLTVEQRSHEFRVLTEELIRNGSGYIAYLSASNGSKTCFDLVPKNSEVNAAMGILADQMPPIAGHYQNRGRALVLRLKPRASLRIYPGTYFVLDGKEILSSSPYYKMYGEQVFLNCPTKDGPFKVFTVLSVEGEEGEPLD